MRNFIEFIERRREQLNFLLLGMNDSMSLKGFQEIAIFAEAKYGFKIFDCSHMMGNFKDGVLSPILIRLDELKDNAENLSEITTKKFVKKDE